MVLTKRQAKKIASAVFSSLGDVWYHPWEWRDMDSLPEGYDWWSREAINAYVERLKSHIADGIQGLNV